MRSFQSGLVLHQLFGEGHKWSHPILSGKIFNTSVDVDVKSPGDASFPARKQSALSISLQSPPSREQGTNTPKATDQFPGDLTLVYAEAKGAKCRTAQKMSLPYHKAILFHARNGEYNPKPMFHCNTVQTRTWLSGCVPPPQFWGAFLKCLHADVARNQEFSKNYLCILNLSFFSPFPRHPPPLQQHILLLFVST